jgi:hypothetical protein
MICISHHSKMWWSLRGRHFFGAIISDSFVSDGLPR